MGRDSTQACDHGRVELWYDTHVHLDRYAPAERDALMERAAEAEVRVIGVAVDLASSVALGECPGLSARTVGLHPNHAAEPLSPELARLAAQPGVVAIGECGFDDAGAPWPSQERAFRAQCQLASALKLGVVLHIDGPQAWECLVSNADALDSLTVIRHYFTGDAMQAAWHAQRGHFLSFGNPLRKQKALRDIAIGYPANRLLIETDSYPLPGRTTEPKDVAKVGETLALVRGWTFEEARTQLAANTRAALGRHLSEE